MSYNQPSGKATVHYDASGRIVAVVLAPEGPNVPPAGILPMPGSKSAEIEIPRELAGMSALEIHESCRVETKGRSERLARKDDIVEDNDGAASPRRRAKKR
jgi:hypothetical protein